MLEFKECVAAVVRMICFCLASALLAFCGVSRTEILLSAVFAILACNELLYVFLCMIEHRNLNKPRSRSRKKTKKINPIRKYIVQLLVCEGFVGIVYAVLHNNGVVVPYVVLIPIILGAALISVLF